DVASRPDLSGEPDRRRAHPIDMRRVNIDHVFAEPTAIEQLGGARDEICFVMIEWRNDMEHRCKQREAGDRTRNRQASICRMIAARRIDGGHVRTLWRPS